MYVCIWDVEASLREKKREELNQLCINMKLEKKEKKASKQAKAHTREGVAGKQSFSYTRALTYKVTCRSKNALIKQHHRGVCGRWLPSKLSVYSNGKLSSEKRLEMTQTKA